MIAVLGAPATSHCAGRNRFAASSRQHPPICHKSAGRSESDARASALCAVVAFGARMHGPFGVHVHTSNFAAYGSTAHLAHRMTRPPAHASQVAPRPRAWRTLKEHRASRMAADEVLRSQLAMLMPERSQTAGLCKMLRHVLSGLALLPAWLADGVLCAAPCR